jgi:PAS domain S-box-containing protein
MKTPLRVLIVEDSADDAALLAYELDAAGFNADWKRVETRAEFQAALAEKPDLIFSDFSLPQFSVEMGLQLLRESGLDIPFIIVSGSIGEERAVQSLKAGATDYLLKDRLGRLAPAVRRALDEHHEREQRKQAEKAQKETEMRLRELAENIQEVFWMTNADKSQMLYVSPAYERIWGRPVASLYQSPGSWAEAIWPDDRARVLGAALTKQTSGEYDEVYRIQRPDGAIRWIRDRAYPIKDESGVLYRVVGTAQDITEQHQLESQLRQAQKLEAIGTLAGGIAHDFNNILGAIVGYSELARSESESLPHVAEYLKEVCVASMRARDLIRQILTFSRQQEHERAPIQLRHVVAEALKLLRAGTPATIQFEIALDRNTPPVLADATQIHQIVMNLGANAAHAMRDRTGVFRANLGRAVVDENALKAHPESKPGVYALLEISDQGHGMDRETMQRIFEPFFTTKPPGEGTGLGLSVVHGIMQSHEGWIDVCSEPGKGTTFHLYFPALPSLEPVEIHSPSELPRGHGELILIVDDEEALLTVCKKIFEKIGYTVVVCSDPASAIKEFSARPADFSLVITDLTMPGMTGIDLAGALWKIRPAMPIILTTGYGGSVTAEGAKGLGLRELVFKPLTIDAAAHAVQRVLRSV